MTETPDDGRPFVAVDVQREAAATWLDLGAQRDLSAVEHRALDPGFEAQRGMTQGTEVAQALTDGALGMGEGAGEALAPGIGVVQMQSPESRL
jgi:hypothetical protein